MSDEIIKPFLSGIIRVCSRCGKVDTKTYARYRLEPYGIHYRYVLHSAYSECQECGNKKEFTKSELKQELGRCK